VGPVWNGGDRGEDELLASCYRQSLLLADANGVGSIAFPAISCGVFRFPPARAAAIAAHTVRQHSASLARVQRVAFVAFDSKMRQLLEEALLHPRHVSGSGD
jgi:O-acetyl-ADP-ribose deacetylase (regulator of RNase III)